MSTKYESTAAPAAAGHSKDNPPKDGKITTTVITPMKFIKKKYKLHMINLDLQDQNIFDINIGNDTFDITEVPYTNATIRSVF